MKRFTLFGSPHSLPTYKVALMLRLSGEPFSFRYVSFRKGMHRTPEFWRFPAGARSPCCVDRRTRPPAIGGHRRASGRDARPVPRRPILAARQAVREWLYWDVDVLSPPIFGCYGVRARPAETLPITVEPVIADYHRRRAEAALAGAGLPISLRRDYLCAARSPPSPTCSATATWPSLKSARSTCVAGRTWPDGPRRMTTLAGFKRRRSPCWPWRTPRSLPRAWTHKPVSRTGGSKQAIKAR